MISKSFCEKFLKNLAREAKPAREKFRGQRAQQNGRVHMAWAWTPHSGRTHFARPPPRVMGTQKALTKTWPRMIVVAHKFTRIWASTRTLYCASITVHKMRPTPHANWASRRTHTAHILRPHLSMYAHNLMHDMVAQTTAGLTRFRQPWTTTNFCGRSCSILGIHKIGSQHALLGTQSRQSLGIHTSFVEVHELLWVAMRYYGRPQDFLSVHAIVLAVHEKLWALTLDTWASSVYRSALPHVTGGLTRYLHGRSRDYVCVHDDDTWTTTRNIMRTHTFLRTPTMLRAHPSRLPGRPRKI